MFRAAFPNAGENDEKAEIHWVKENFDLSGNNGSSNDPHTTRLAGTWIDPQLALELAKDYSLGSLVKIIVDATPDPNGNYRRSARGTTVGPATSVLAPPLKSTTSTTVLASTAQSSTIVVSKTPSSTKTLPTPSPTSTKPPSKRRKETLSVPSPAASSVKPLLRVSASPSASKTTVVAPRRSNRKSKSPAPRTMAPLPVRTPKRGIRKDQSAMTSSSLDLAAVDEEGQIVEDGVAGTELMEEDIKEQKRLITELKKEEEAALPSWQPGETSMEESDHTSTSSKKREREDEDQPLAFEFKEPEKEERAIATNSRVTRFTLEPRTKSFAWGVAAFAVGMGAV